VSPCDAGERHAIDLKCQIKIFGCLPAGGIPVPLPPGNFSPSSWWL
jgi:hypothetical protein